MEPDMRYAVVKFPQDNTVDVVPSNWLEKTKEGIYCYWPRKNFTAKAKKRETPDTTFWSKHVAVVLVYADSYEEARLKANQATVSSNLESEEEPPRRPVRPPARYRRELDSGDDEDSPPPKTHILSTPKFTPRTEYFEERRQLNTPSCGNTQQSFISAQEPETTEPDRETQHEADVAEGVPASARETSLYNTELKKLERALFIRLDKMDQKLSTVETLLRSVAQPSDISEFLLDPCKSTQELEELCLRMKDSECRKKTVHYLSLLGGRTPGDAVRRVLRTVGVNSVWSQYSMKGRKGKKTFQDLEICSVIIQACQKMHPKVQVKVFEEYIAETLKYAPHRDSRNALQFRKYLVRACARPVDTHTGCHRVSHALEIANKGGIFRMGRLLSTQLRMPMEGAYRL